MHATLPAAYAEAFLSFFVLGTLDESVVQPTVRDVLGREPATFAAWARATRTPSDDLLSYRTPTARASSAHAARTICARSPTSTIRRTRDRRGGAMRSSGGIVHDSRSARVIADPGPPDVLDDDRSEPDDEQGRERDRPHRELGVGDDGVGDDRRRQAQHRADDDRAQRVQPGRVDPRAEDLRVVAEQQQQDRGARQQDRRERLAARHERPDRDVGHEDRRRAQRDEARVDGVERPRLARARCSEWRKPRASPTL